MELLLGVSKNVCAKSILTEELLKVGNPDIIMIENMTSQQVVHMCPSVRRSIDVMLPRATTGSISHSIVILSVWIRNVRRCDTSIQEL